MKTLLSYPKIQQEFVSQFDGTLINALKFANLSEILNPCFSAQYLIVKLGETIEDTLTTRDTTGQTICLTASEEQQKNASKLAIDLKRFLLSYNPVRLDSIVKEHSELRAYTRKIDRVKKVACFFIEGQMFVCKGLNLPKSF